MQRLVSRDTESARITRGAGQTTSAAGECFRAARDPSHCPTAAGRRRSVAVSGRGNQATPGRLHRVASDTPPPSTSPRRSNRRRSPVGESAH
ncbi:hypothetical protein LSAT2_022367 [Lamellibrachia satsuma]|nr:hypothetical protein LSAT2_022367 [Lamellibrachia satsuma]